MQSKRAEISTITLIEIVLGLFVAVTFLYAADAMSNPNTYEQLAVAKDVALLVDTLQTAPQDAHYEYPESLLGANIVLDREKVAVVADGSGELTKDLVLTHYRYHPSKLMNVQPAIVDGGFFIIEKTGRDILLYNQSPEEDGTGQVPIVQEFNKEEVRFAIQAEDHKRFATQLEAQLLEEEYIVDNSNPTITIVISKGVENIIYHSSSLEATLLGQVLHGELSKSLDILVLKGTKTITNPNVQFIELSMKEDMDDSNIYYGIIVVNTLEALYE